MTRAYVSGAWRGAPGGGGRALSLTLSVIRKSLRELNSPPPILDFRGAGASVAWRWRLAESGVCLCGFRARERGPRRPARCWLLYPPQTAALDKSNTALLYTFQHRSLDSSILRIVIRLAPSRAPHCEAFSPGCSRGAWVIHKPTSHPACVRQPVIRTASS